MPVSGLERFAPNRETPDDFDALWVTTLAELEAVAPAVDVVAVGFGNDEAPAAGPTLQRLTFESIGGARIAAYLLAAPGPGPRPLIVHAHGYGARYDVMTRWGEQGCHLLGFDARGFGRSRDAADPASEGYVLTGIESPYRSILRGAVADYLQAVNVARGLLGPRVARVVFYGFSFGGALALMAAALGGAADLVVLGQPTFGWNGERLRLALAGSSAELRRYIEARPSRRAIVLRTMQYFDTMNFAPRIVAPTLVGIGLDDDVVPSRTVLAAVNQMTCPLELRLLPVSHSADPRESLWNAFETEWLEYAVTGLPADFGRRALAVQSILPEPVCGAAGESPA